MKLNELTSVLERLQSEGIRFLVAGGLAVVAHGHSRVTHDLDLVLAMDDENLTGALSIFEKLGFSPRLPVDLYSFADPNMRAGWIRDKGLQVFSLVSETHRTLVIDLFAETPFSFEAEWASAAWIAFPDASLQLPFVSLPTLINMKREAGRPVDKEDLVRLQELFEADDR